MSHTLVARATMSPPLSGPMEAMHDGPAVKVAAGPTGTMRSATPSSGQAPRKPGKLFDSKKVPPPAPCQYPARVKARGWADEVEGIRAGAPTALMGVAFLRRIRVLCATEGRGKRCRVRRGPSQRRLRADHSWNSSPVLRERARKAFPRGPGASNLPV